MRSRYRCDGSLRISATEVLEAVISNHNKLPYKKSYLQPNTRIEKIKSRRKPPERRRKTSTEVGTTEQKEASKHRLINVEKMLDYLDQKNDDEKRWQYLGESFTFSELQGCYVDLTTPTPTTVPVKNNASAKDEQTADFKKSRSSSCKLHKKEVVTMLPKCKWCDKRFKSCGHLERHQVVHDILSKGDGGEAPQYMSSKDWILSVAKAKQAVKGNPFIDC